MRQGWLRESVLERVRLRRKRKGKRLGQLTLGAKEVTSRARRGAGRGGEKRRALIQEAPRARARERETREGAPTHSSHHRSSHRPSFNDQTIRSSSSFALLPIPLPRLTISSPHSSTDPVHSLLSARQPTSHSTHPPISSLCLITTTNSSPPHLNPHSPSHDRTNPIPPQTSCSKGRRCFGPRRGCLPRRQLRHRSHQGRPGTGCR